MASIYVAQSEMFVLKSLVLSPTNSHFKPYVHFNLKINVAHKQTYVYKSIIIMILVKQYKTLCNKLNFLNSIKLFFRFPVLSSTKCNL